MTAAIVAGAEPGGRSVALAPIGTAYVRVRRKAWGRLGEMRGRRPTSMVGALLVLLAAACSETGIGHGPSISPPPTSESPSPTVSPGPTGSPGPESALNAGTATLSVSGDLTISVP